MTQTATHPNPSRDYHAVVYTNDAGTQTYNIEKERWNPPNNTHRRNKQTIATGAFWEVLEEVNLAKYQQQEQEQAPF